MNKVETICRVCGWDNSYPTWSEDGKTPSYSTCTCCGVYFGDIDSTAEGVRSFRNFWIKQDCKWYDPNAKPANWSLEDQLKNVPDPQSIAWITDLNTFCRVCGHDNVVPPWGIDGKRPTWDYCECCGVEFGYQDYIIDSIREYRQKWIDNGCSWDEPKKKPEDWSLEEQMKNIPNEFR